MWCHTPSLAIEYVSPALTVFIAETVKIDEVSNLVQALVFNGCSRVSVLSGIFYAVASVRRQAGDYSASLLPVSKFNPLPSSSSKIARLSCTSSFLLFPDSLTAYVSFIILPLSSLSAMHSSFSCS